MKIKIAKIKILIDIVDANLNSIRDKEIDACLLIVKDMYHFYYDTGFDYPGCLVYQKDLVSKYIDIVSEKDINDDTSDKIKSMDLIIKDQKDKIEQAKEEIINLKSSKTDRDYSGNEYVILPLGYLDNELIGNIKKNGGDILLGPDDIAAMYVSASLEIIKGDRSSKSLNVKLYKALREFGQDEMDAILE